MSVSSILDTIAKHKTELRQFGILRIGIFGSQARGTAAPESDIDLLLEFDPTKKTYRNFFGSTTYLEGVLGKTVDPVTTEGLSPYIRPHVERDVQYVQIRD